MENAKKQRKINEVRYLIVIPLVITVICLWLDVWTSYANGSYTDKDTGVSKGEMIGQFVLQSETENPVVVYSVHNDVNWIDNITSIIRCGLGYLFPALLSIVIVMIWQQINSKGETYGVQRAKTGWSLAATVLYSLIFITCLIKYNIWTALFVVLSSVIYIWYVYTYCLDERIKPRHKSQMTGDEILLQYLNKNQGGNEHENN